MSRVLPAPILSLVLFVLWLLLMQSASAGTIVLGVILALAWPAMTAGLRPAPVRIRRPHVVVALTAAVVWDMLASNAQVAWAILTKRSRSLRSGFVQIPLELRDPNGLAALAAIVTFTPGTAWAQLSADGRVLLLHVLELDDPSAVIATVKGRYERRLREIFE